MNRIDLLPDDIIDNIYYESHKKMSIHFLGDIKGVDTNRFSPESLFLELFDSDMSNDEVREFYKCLDWLDGKKLNITREYINGNKYYNLYLNIWDDFDEFYMDGEYMVGNYI